MYNVMLVDDDYPVLEFLSEEVDWDLIGLHLQSIHENGVSALEHALNEMPDILVTDIGMPKMNGLELTEKLKNKNPNLQVAILSCHNEFEYAQRAITLNVQDYILKETLDPNDFAELLTTYKKRLDNQTLKIQKQNKLLHEMNRNKELVKEKFIRELIYQSAKNQVWYLEDNPLNFKLEKIPYIPILCLVDNYVSIKEYFNSEDTLRFAMKNIIDDVMHESNIELLYFNFELNRSLLLIPNQLSLSYHEIEKLLEKIQSALEKYLKISTSFFIGESTNPKQLQSNLKKLTTDVGQYFYRETYSINRLEKSKIVFHTNEDLFSFYDEAEIEFRNAILKNDDEKIMFTIEKWIDFIKEKTFPSKTVKEWVLKLLLDLKVKLQSSHYIESNFNLEILNHEIIFIDSIDELKKWFIKSIKSAQLLMLDAPLKTKHKEIFNACIYISQNLESKLTLEEVAKHVYLNPSYFSRLFKKEIGKTFVEYVTSLKMDRAKELLDQTTYTVSEISEKLGYDNQSYFIKLFKNLVGKTPTEYRGDQLP